ncbi:MAG: hypothetical protein JO256_02045, partial [Alphaproteobacteria bacterium]|nr:hypothetical protein [Alphaproteobacteria bacterium]
ENIAPKGAFLYELASRNWINAYDDTEAKLTEVAKGLARLVKSGARDESVLPFERVAAKPDGVFVAVLPFENLSSDREQEFFSDGMTQEITAALAKVPGLKVIARSSAFQFKGQARDLHAIGRALGAGYLVEGSVRKAGDQVRITAQLVRSDDATSLWAESYNRQLTNIFAVQEEIAQAIVGALHVPLGLQGGQRLVSNRTGNLEAYQHYLRARALMNGLYFDEARKILEAVVVSDPGFAPAWAQLAIAYALLPTFTPVIRSGPVEEARRLIEAEWPKAEKAAREAIRLDPRLSIGHMALAFTLVQRANYVAADDECRTALSLDGGDPALLHIHGMLLGATGHLAEARRKREELRRLEPFIPIYNSVSATILRTGGDNKAALPMLEAARQPGAVGTLWTNAPLAQTYAAMGRFEEAADTILAIQESPFIRRQVLEQAAGMLRQAPGKLAGAETGPFLDEWLSWIYLYAGAPERALEGEERRVQIGLIDFFYNVWLPEYAAVRKTERFKALMRATGVVAYWKARGWPDLCRLEGDDDFVCR